MELQDLKDENIKLRNFAIDIVKYQNFKTKSALDRMNTGFSKVTTINYFDAGVKYIKTKVKDKVISKKLIRYIDEALEQHVQPLTPSEDDKRMVYKKIFTNKDAVLPVANLVKDLTKEQPLIEKFEYGVRVKDTVKVFKSREQADFFLEGVLFGGEDVHNARIVHVQNLGE